ncbi:MAG: LysM peptidoglycan-binding domain-containing protein [Gammaproteobacteria bacterium]|nr:LysM peptidoglycan-binding domain-containing protein [Gammaproteobacteria bacterium]
MLRSYRVNNALGQMSDYYEYNTSSVITRHEQYVYDDDNTLLVQRDIDISDPHIKNITTFSYLADGTLANSYTRTLEDGIPNTRKYPNIWQYYAYAKWDGYKQSSVTIKGDAKDVASWKPGTTTYKYDANGHLRELYDHVQDRTIRYVNNHLGQVMKRYQSEVEIQVAHPKEPIIRRFFYLNGIAIGDVGTDKVPSRIDYAQVLADRKDKGGGHIHGDLKDRVTPVTSADFDQNFRPIGPDYPSKTPGTYVVNAGDTLQSIASAVWGDASLWYLIADANGLTGSEALPAGTRLAIPNVVTNVHNTSETFRPYDPRLILGDTTPTLPAAKPKSHIFAMLIAIIIFIVICYVGGAYAAETTWPQVMAVTGFASVASQMTAVALGLQDKINWKRVAVDAAMAGVFQSEGISVAENTSTASTMLNSMLRNTVSQGLNIAIGNQKKFDWQGVAAAGLASGITAQMGPGRNPVGFGENFTKGLRDSLVQGAVNNAIYDKDDPESQFDFVSVAATALGHAIGSSMVENTERNRRYDLQRQFVMDQPSRNRERAMQLNAEQDRGDDLYEQWGRNYLRNAEQDRNDVLNDRAWEEIYDYERPDVPAEEKRNKDITRSSASNSVDASSKGPLRLRLTPEQQAAVGSALAAENAQLIDRQQLDFLVNGPKTSDAFNASVRRGVQNIVDFGELYASLIGSLFDGSFATDPGPLQLQRQQAQNRDAFNSRFHSVPVTEVTSGDPITRQLAINSIFAYGGEFAGENLPFMLVPEIGATRYVRSSSISKFSGLFGDLGVANNRMLFSPKELMGVEPASSELLAAVGNKRDLLIARPGSEELRMLDYFGAEASVGGVNRSSIILRENPSKAAVLEEFLHGTQERLGIIDRLGTSGYGSAETHVKDFMIRHQRMLGLGNEDVRILQILKEKGL